MNSSQLKALATVSIDQAQQQFIDYLVNTITSSNELDPVLIEIFLNVLDNGTVQSLIVGYLIEVLEENLWVPV